MLPKICSIPECGKKAFAVKMCNRHYLESRPKVKCTIDGCDKQSQARGWCSRHLTRWQRHGSPLAGGPDRPRVLPVERFWSKVEKTGTCWNWSGVPSDTGYGHIMFEGKYQGAHRVSWEIHRGPIPAGMHIDHKCHNRICVNPSHLRVTTPKQNFENHQGATSASTTGARGVYANKRSGGYYTQVTHNLQRYSAGSFLSVKEAEAAVTELRNRLFTHNDLDRFKV